jgi:hypothetical protein
MASRTSTYWTCSACEKLNIAQVDRCVMCDTSNSTPPPKWAPARSANAPLPASQQQSPPPRSLNYQVQHSPSPMMSPTYARGSTPPLSPPMHGGGGGGGGGSPSAARSYMRDADSKSAIVARLEQHVQSTMAQMNSQREAHRAEISSVERQLHNALTSHQAALGEYRKAAAELSARRRARR